MSLLDITKFNSEHSCCPKCGNGRDKYKITTGGNLPNNRVLCLCGWKGKAIQLVPKNDISIKIRNRLKELVSSIEQVNTEESLTIFIVAPEEDRFSVYKAEAQIVEEFQEVNLDFHFDAK